MFFLGVLLSRETSVKEDLPVFSPIERSFVYVEMSGDGLVPGIYQFNDGLALPSVMKLTDHELSLNLPNDLMRKHPLLGGESFEIARNGQEIEICQQGWMSAGKRIALAILLHPDRMNKTDWLSLPGIGAVLAERIESDRQKNGDFVRFESLARVKGIGEKRLKSWKDFFDKV